MISGDNYGFDLHDQRLSYSFSKHGYIWGWATWKRCWEKFDLDLGFLNEISSNLIKSNISNNREFVDYWWKGVDDVLFDRVDTWDAQWGVVRYANNFLTIRPKVNLIANIGFGKDATHTTGIIKRVYTQTNRMDFPLVHPITVLPDSLADEKLEKFFLPAKPQKRNTLHQISQKILDRIRKFLN